MRARFIAAALFATIAVGVGGTAATTGAHAQPASAPDTYVSYWDALPARPSPRRR
jgi:hypothetical protein